MNESQILLWLSSLIPHGQLILSILGGLVVIGQVVVVLSPSTKDDEAWEKIKAFPVIGPFLSALAAFAPIHKKEPADILKIVPKPPSDAA